MDSPSAKRKSSARQAPPVPGREPRLPGPIGFLLVPEFTVIALASAIEPLRIANRYLPVASRYAWYTISVDGTDVRDRNGIVIRVDHTYARAPRLGTLIVCADLRPERFLTPALQRWLQRCDREGATLGGLDTGSMLLGAAGLLDGCAVTVHWEVAGAFRDRFPRADLRPTLFEVGRRRMSCAGGTAVIDMMLAAIQQDHGAALAQRVAEHCLHETIRAGTQAQRNAPAADPGRHRAVTEARRLLAAEPARALGERELARRVGLSVRHLTRLFRRELMTTPAAFRRARRLEHARALLRLTDLPVTEVALACGFVSASHFARCYRVLHGHPPSAERRLPFAPPAGEFPVPAA